MFSLEKGTPSWGSEVLRVSSPSHRRYAKLDQLLARGITEEACLLSQMSRDGEVGRRQWV